MEGVASFFREVARGGQTRALGQLDQQGIQLDQQYKRGRADQALTAARIARDEELRRLEIADALQANGLSAEQAGAFSTLVRGGAGNAQQVAQAMGQFGQNAGMEMARSAMQSGDWEAMNRGLAVFQGRPVDTTKIASGMAFNPLATPEQDMRVTPLGEASIGLDMARAAKAREEARFVAPRAESQIAANEARARNSAALAWLREQDNAALDAPIPRPAAVRQPAAAEMAVTPSGVSVEARARAASIVEQLPKPKTQADVDRYLRWLDEAMQQPDADIEALKEAAALLGLSAPED
jgi:hypothetical protein